MKRILLFILPLFFFCSCRFLINESIPCTKWDVMIIPDKYNCGVQPGTQLTVVEDTTTELVPGMIIQYRTDTKQFNLSSYKSPNLPEKATISNMDFSNHAFVTNSMGRYTGIKTITFENCKFKGFRNDAVGLDATGKVYFIFNHCSFSGNVSDSYITLNDCKIGGFTSDAMNPLREFYANNLYVYDLAHEASAGEVHLDGIQIFGDQRSRNNVIDDKWVTKVETGEIHFNNIRFEIPSINLGANNKAYVNACVMFQLEFSGVDNVSFKNLYVNGGGKWYPLYMDHGKNRQRSEDGENWSHKNLVMENAMVSNNYGKIFYPDFLEDATVINVDHHDYLFVSSVWKDSNGIVHLIVTNDTNSDKNLVIKTNNGTYTHKIPHCPSNWALCGQIDTRTNPDESLTDASGKPYTEYKFEDFPFDIELTVPDNPDFILCYQGEEQIRYMIFDGKKHSYSEIQD